MMMRQWFPMCAEALKVINEDALPQRRKRPASRWVGAVVARNDLSGL